MVKEALLVAAVALSAGPTAFAPGRQPSTETATATVTIEIPEVRCATCAIEARKAVKSVGGIVQLAEGEPKNRLVVTYELASDRPGAYIEALHRAGFVKAHEVRSI